MAVLADLTRSSEVVAACVSACGEPPKRSDFSRARVMERIRFVSRSRMSRRHIVSAQDAQSRSLELFEQLRAGPQAQMLRQVGKDQPPLTARRRDALAAR